MAPGPVEDAYTRMDRMYRYQRYVYDLTRKYYLFGRDRLIAELPAQPGEHICEVGCGTARNLIALALRFPATQFYGVDASAEILRTAAANVSRQRLESKITLAVGLAQNVSPGVFGLQQPFDRIIFSYALSIMDDWRAALEQGLRQLKPGGTLHIVDFGDQAGLPVWFKIMLGAWLARFHVRFRPEVRAAGEAWMNAGHGRMSFRPVLRGYAYRLDFVKAAAGAPLDLPIVGNPT